MKSDFLLAFNEIAEMRKLPREVIMEALEAALVSAYRRNASVGSAQLVEARIDDTTGEAEIWVEKEVVDDVQNVGTEIEIKLARTQYPDVEMGDMVMVENTPHDFGRIAAQTAKQVILQRMREAEREAQFQEYQDRVGDLVTGTVQSDSGGVVTIGLGRTEAILPQSQQMRNERYRMHSKVRAYVMDVKKTNRGPQIVVSRTHRNMLRRLLEYEVPEIYNGTVEIKSIAREPGARSKVAVAALQEGADPVGACVGMRGVRIQSIVKELNNEKIDVIEWNPDQEVFISKALSPARVSRVFLDDDPDEGRTAIVVVPDDQLSLAIGKEGQNARLAAKLTGWRIDIKSVTETASDALRHLDDDPELATVGAEMSEMVDQVRYIMEKKEANRPIMPEDYEALKNFIGAVEGHRHSVREAIRDERRTEIQAARSQVPDGAYLHPLGETDLPLRVYNILTEAHYETVGQVMEQYLVDPAKLEDLGGIGPTAMTDIEAMINTPEFYEATMEVELPEAVDTDEEAVEDLADEEAVAVAAEVIEPVEAEAEIAAAVPDAAVDPMWDEEAEARARRAALVAELGSEPLSGSAADPDQVGVVQETPDAGESLREDEASYEDREEFGDIEDLDQEDTDRRTKGKTKRRQLVYDEELGRVVAKRRYKRGGKPAWDEWASTDTEDEF